MSGGRQTGTVPKTKHNTRTRRENTVNHIPNNLDWHDSYQPQRARKESNTSASRHSDAGDDMYEDNPWIGLAPQTHRPDEDEVRWSNVKSSNLTPERSSTLSNVEAYMGANRSLHRQENASEERESSSSSKEAISRGRIKLRMEQRKIEELQQHQAVLMTLRNKAIQQVKPVQASNVEEVQQQPPSLMSLRNKAIQQVKPVQQEEIDRVGNVDGRLQNIQDYASIIQVLERDDASNLETGDGQSEQQLRKKLNELLAKKARVDRILAYIDSDHVADAALSLSSDEGEGFPRSHGAGDTEEIARRDVTKQDNREQATSAAYLQIKELKLEDIRNKLEQLQTMLARVERTSMRDSRPVPRINGETSSHCSDTPMHGQVKNCPSNSILEKLHTKKFDLDHVIRKVKSNPSANNPQGFAFNQTNVENWATPSQGTTQASGVEYSSDEAEADYDESPVKLCSASLQSYLPHGTLSKTRSHAENMTNGTQSLGKYPTGGGRTDSRDCSIHLDADDRVRQQPQITLQDVSTTANNTALALQISQLQLQMEQMQMLYQSMLEKQQVNVFSSPQPWLPPNNMGFMQFMSPSAQWHQHQLLVNSLNQCCQLIWHQQRELAGLRQALTMLQEEGSIYKCPTTGYGNNLNFDAGLIWTQPSPQMLNNQVPPGNRANNYWDNFRSYSRQNLLSGRNKSNEGSLAESLPVTRPSPQTDNLRPKDNSCSTEGRGKVLRCRQQPHQDTNGPNISDQNSGRSHNSRRFNSSSKNLKPDPTDVHSLEQSVYSELETVITETERNPDMLLQLLSQLKTMRSQHQRCSFQDNLACLENDCEILDAGNSMYSRIEHQRNQTSSMSYDHDGPKLEVVLEEINRLVQECDICSPDLLQQIVGLILRAFHLTSHHEIVTRLEASLLKFQGARIGQVGDELLCVIASVLSPHVPSTRGTSHTIEERESSMIDQIEEEGAVGGVLLTASQRSAAQSVETELAEADQPQHNPGDTIEVFDTEDAVLPGIELDSQDLPPREGNSDQPIQET